MPCVHWSIGRLRRLRYWRLSIVGVGTARSVSRRAISVVGTKSNTNQINICMMIAASSATISRRDSFFAPTTGYP